VGRTVGGVVVQCLVLMMVPYNTRPNGSIVLGS
jgi:hypothetical protein